MLEPDADHDGFGDETQDQCPTHASTQGPCPPPPALPLPASAPFGGIQLGSQTLTVKNGKVMATIPCPPQLSGQLRRHRHLPQRRQARRAATRDGEEAQEDQDPDARQGHVLDPARQDREGHDQAEQHRAQAARQEAHPQGEAEGRLPRLAEQPRDNDRGGQAQARQEEEVLAARASRRVLSTGGDSGRAFRIGRKEVVTTPPSRGGASQSHPRRVSASSARTGARSIVLRCAKRNHAARGSRRQRDISGRVSVAGFEPERLASRCLDATPSPLGRRRPPQPLAPTGCRWLR